MFFQCAQEEGYDVNISTGALELIVCTLIRVWLDGVVGFEEKV